MEALADSMAVMIVRYMCMKSTHPITLSSCNVICQSYLSKARQKYHIWHGRVYGSVETDQGNKRDFVSGLTHR